MCTPLVDDKAGLVYIRYCLSGHFKEVYCKDAKAKADRERERLKQVKEAEKSKKKKKKKKK